MLNKQTSGQANAWRQKANGNSTDSGYIVFHMNQESFSKPSTTNQDEISKAKTTEAVAI
jgi:hypothetical protein